MNDKKRMFLKWGWVKMKKALNYLVGLGEDEEGTQLLGRLTSNLLG
jgi:hypothetical protein